MLKIKLTQNKYAIVDDDDYESLMRNSWCFSSQGYAKRGTKSKGKTTIHYMHRQIMGYPKGYVDHINGDKLDNRKSNLRAVPQSINGINRNFLNKNNKTGHTGVWFDKARNKYVAEIWVYGKKISTRFNTKEQAISARKEMKNNAIAKL